MLSPEPDLNEMRSLDSAAQVCSDEHRRLSEARALRTQKYEALGSVVLTDRRVGSSAESTEYAGAAAAAGRRDEHVVARGSCG